MQILGKNHHKYLQRKTLKLRLKNFVFFPLLSMVNKKCPRSGKMLIAKKEEPVPPVWKFW